MPARRKSAAAEAAQAQPTPAEEAAPPVAVAAAAGPSSEEPKRPPFPTWASRRRSSSAPGRTARRLRLRRGHRYNQVQISPDGELPDWAQERLKDAGWRDRVEDEGIYTKQLPPRAPAGRGEPGADGGPPPGGSLTPSRFFEALVNDIRQERGMKPVRLGMAAER